MNLKIYNHFVEDIEFYSETKLINKTLYINKEEIEKIITLPVFSKAEVNLAKPSDETRIIHLLDVVEPRYKLEGKGRVFPGFLGAPVTVGSGITARLANVAVMATGRLQNSMEAIIDMSGIATDYSPYGKTLNVVLSFEREESVTENEFDDAIRMVTLRCADYLASTTVGLNPDSVEEFELTHPEKPLPKVALIQQLHAIRANRIFVYGLSYKMFLPTIIHPNEFFDGAVVGGNHHYSTLRLTTYLFQNSAIAKELIQRNGKDIHFVGVILTYPSGYSHDDKVRFSQYCAQLAKILGADGVVLSQNGGGHGFVDTMMTCEACENIGIKTVLMVNEMSGKDGRDTPLLDVSEKADAMITNGNYAQELLLPKMKLVLGGTAYFDSPRDPYDEGLMALRNIHSSTIQIGIGHLTAAQY